MKSRRAPVRRLVLCVTACLSCLTVPAEEKTNPYVVQCDIERGRLIAPAALNGRSGFSALIDAGLQAPVVSQQALAALGLAVDGGQAALRSLRLSSKIAHEGDAATADLAALSERIGKTVDVIAPLYQPGLELTLEAGQGRITYRPMAEAQLGAKGGGVSPMRLRDGAAPVVQALIDDKHLRDLEIDLNYPGVVALSPETVAAMGLFDKDPPALRTVNGAGQTSVQFRLHALRLGTASLDAPICEMAPGRDRLGLGALQHFQLTLNFEAGLAHWASNAGARISRQEISGYGITLDRLRAGQWELAVAEGSPAAEAGILPGAVLAGIGAVPLRQTSHAAVGRLLRASEGQELTLTIIQDGAPQDVTLTARGLL
jgi:hypothetical protein